MESFTLVRPKGELDRLQSLPGWLFWTAAVALIIGAGVFAFQNSFDNGLTNWTDPETILGNESIRSLSPSSVRDIFRSARQGRYTPLAVLSYAVDYQFSDGLNNLWMFHFSNLAFHLLSAILLMTILQKTFHSRLFAVSAALIFTVLPVNTEAVVWLSARRETLSLFFSLLSLFFFIRFLELEGARRRSVVYALAFMFSLAAMLSKGNAVALPLLFLLYHLSFFAGGGETVGGNLRKMMLKFHYHVPFLLTALAMAFIHIGVMRSDEAITGGGAALSMVERLQTTAGILVEYMISFVRPETLSPDYGIPAAGGLSPSQVVAAILVIVLPPTMWVLFSYNRLLFFVLGWFLIAMAPYCNLFPMDVMKADRYMYIASISYALVLAYIVVLIWYAASRRPVITRLAAASILAFTVAFYANATRVYSDTWQSSATLWEQVLSRHPRNVQARYHLARHYLTIGKRHLARLQLELALDLDKDHARMPAVLNELALIHLHNREFNLAIVLLDPVLKADGLHGEATDKELAAFARLFNTRGQAQEQLQLLEYAKRDFARAVELARLMRDRDRQTPVLKVCLFNYGTALGQMNQFNGAEIALRQCLDLDREGNLEPGNQLVTDNLSKVLQHAGKPDEALDVLLTGLQRWGEDPDLLGGLGRIYVRQGKDEEGRLAFRRIVDIDPQDMILRLEVANFLYREGLEDYAEEIVRDGLVYPSFVSYGNQFLYNLYFSQAQAIHDNPQDARQIFDELLPLLKQAIDLNTSNISADLLYIDYMTKAQRFDETEDAWQRLLPYFPTLSDLHVQFADFYKQWGHALMFENRRDEAREKFEIYLDVVPPNTEVDSIRSLLSNLKTRELRSDLEDIFAAVEDLLKQALSGSGPERKAALNNAAETLESAIDFDPEHPGYYYYAGRIAFAREQYTIAYEAFRKSIKQSGNLMSQPDALFWAGKSSFYAGEFETAMNELNQYLNFTQWNTPEAEAAGILLYEMGRAFRQQDRHDLAASAFDKALGLELGKKNWSHLHYLLGVELIAIRHFTRARRELMRYQEKTRFQGEYSGETGLLVSDIDIRLNQYNRLLDEAKNQIAAGEYGKAENAIRNCIKDLPFNQNAREMLGDWFLAQERGQEAEAEYEASIDLDPTGARALSAQFKLGQLFYKRGELQQAKRKLNLILHHREGPTQPFFDATLNLLEEIQTKLDSNE